MAAISFPVTGLQPIPRDQLGSAPVGTGGPQAVNPNQQDAPEGDTVTISATFPPAQAAQQSATVKLEEFSVFITQTEAQAAQNNPPANDPAATQGAAAPLAANQPNAQAAAAAAAADPATGAINDAATQAGAASTPQQELAQLDQTLQQLGIDPQSISLFNRIGLLLYANDPVALQNLVNTLQAVDQQLGQLGLLGAATNAANQPQAAAQDLLPPALQAQAQVQTQATQGNAQVPLGPLIQPQGTTPAQAPATAPAQVQAQNQNQPGNTAANVFTVQLSFSDVQATIQQQTAPAQGTASNQPSANSTANAPSGQANNLLVNLQEFQLTFQAVEGQAQQQPTADQGNSTTQGQGQALNVLF
jgi:hypothetical protein